MQAKIFVNVLYSILLRIFTRIFGFFTEITSNCWDCS